MQNRPQGKIGSWKAAVIGGLIALGLLTITRAFLGDPNLTENREMFLPFIFVPVAGGIGGLIYTFINSLHFHNAQLAIFANFFSVLLYLFLVLIAFTLGIEI